MSNDKLAKMRQSVGPLTPIPGNSGLFEDTTATPQNTQQEPEKHISKGSDEPSTTKQRFTVSVNADSIEKARQAVYYTPGLTLSALVERAIQAEIEVMERERGTPFPEGEEVRLSVGRPLVRK
jgi:hypothetical protein